MATLFLEYNGDLVVSPTGGLLMANGWDETRQRIERNLFTVPQQVQPDGSNTVPDYLFDKDFGQGLAQRLGGPMTPQAIADVEHGIMAAVTRDPNVAQGVAPTIVGRKADKFFYLQVLVPLATGQQGQMVLRVQ